MARLLTMIRFLNFARDMGAFIEDAAEALGASYKGKPAVPLRDGGIFVQWQQNCHHKRWWDARVAKRRLHRTGQALASQARDPFPYYHHTSVGYNYRLSNLLAALAEHSCRI